MQKVQFSEYGAGGGVKWHEWWQAGQADDDYYCYHAILHETQMIHLLISSWTKSEVDMGLWPHIYSDILQNIPFRSQIFKIFFASGGPKGGIDPLSKILRTSMAASAI